MWLDIGHNQFDFKFSLEATWCLGAGLRTAERGYFFPWKYKQLFMSVPKDMFPSMLSLATLFRSH